MPLIDRDVAPAQAALLPPVQKTYLHLGRLVHTYTVFWEEDT